MDLLRLQLENYCGHSYSDIQLSDISAAIIIGKIKGNDKFSNGSGKSSIFDAIEYVLFNTTSFSTLDRIIRHGTEYCKVILDFKSSTDNEIYRIARTKGKKSSDVRLFKKVNEEWNDITEKRNSDTEKEIAKIIKIDYKTFCNSVLFRQFDFLGLAALTPEKRKLVLKEALGLNIYGKYEASAKKLANELNKEIEKEKIILSTFGNPSDDILKFKEELLQTNYSIQEKSKYITEIKEKLEIENTNINKLIQYIDNFEANNTNIRNKKANITAEIKKVSAELSNYNLKISQLKEAGVSLIKETKEINKQINSIIKSEKSVDTLKLEIEDKTKQYFTAKAKHSSLLSQIQDLKIPLPADALCKSCRREINDIERSECQKKINEDLFSKENTFKDIEKELLSLNNELVKSKNDLKKIELDEVLENGLKIKLESKNKEIELKRSVYQEYDLILNTNKNNLENLNKELISIIEIKSDEYEEYKINLQSSKNILNIYSKLLEKENIIFNTYSNNIAILNHKIEQKEKDIVYVKNSNDKINKLNKDYILHQKVITAFGSSGIPALITHTILDDYQIETNMILSKFRPGLQLEFFIIKDRSDGDKDDTLEIIYHIDGYDVEYKQLSGAQKLLVSLSLKLGLAAIIKKRLGVELNFLLIDEVDQSIDEGTIEVFEDAIKKLQKDYKVLVITHNNELKSKFNRAILVEQDENSVSTAKLVETW